MPPPRQTPAESRTYYTRSRKRRDSQANRSSFDGNANLLVHYVLNQVGLKKGLQVYKEQGMKAAVEEFKQIHGMNTFEPINSKTMTVEEK